jgi:hypothetical protein
MDKIKWPFDRKIIDLSFYKYPFFNISIATKPAIAVEDASRICYGLYSDTVEDAITFLQLIIDGGQNVGLQIFLLIESTDYLPEGHQLTLSIMALEKSDRTFFTSPSSEQYSFNKFQTLFIGI